MNQKDRVSAVITTDCGSLLLIKRTTPERVYWVFPGGGIESGETVVKALEREIYEETSLKIKAASPIFCILNRSRREHFFHVTTEMTPVSLSKGGPEYSSQCKANQYAPQWVKTSQLSSLNLMPESAKPLIQSILKIGSNHEK